MKVRKPRPHPPPPKRLPEHDPQPELPTPTPGYRRRAWLEFQLALDPLAQPRPLRPPLPR
ncbi:MAG TPA: hypothetical protein VFY02_02315 [Gaiellaceae bacterium]|nr:hypothetical protein [Gaiellaceae bacterium]